MRDNRHMNGFGEDGIRPTVPTLALSVIDAAKAIGMSERKMRQLIASGQLRSKRCGRRVLVTVRALEDFLAGPDVD